VKHSGHASMVKIFEEIIKPYADRYRPDLILASAGFDGHRDDPFHSLSYTEDTYMYIGYSLSTLADVYCGGRALFVLEGGYNLEALSSSVSAFLSGATCALNEVQNAAISQADEKSIDVIDEVKRIHSL